MKSFEEIQKCWKEGRNTVPATMELSNTVLEKLIRSGVKKEQKMVWEYCVASGFWQWLIYAALTHFIVRFWGDWKFVSACAALIVLYIPFTAMFIKKFRHMRILKFNKSALLSQDIHASLTTQHKMLKDFFVFKKRFDWLNVPVCCLLIVLILHKYNVIPSFSESIAAWIVVFFLYVVLFIVAIYFENKKRFRVPLEKMEEVIREMEEAG